MNVIILISSFYTSILILLSSLDSSVKNEKLLKLYCEFQDRFKNYSHSIMHKPYLELKNKILFWTYHFFLAISIGLIALSNFIGNLFNNSEKLNSSISGNENCILALFFSSVIGLLGLNISLKESAKSELIISIEFLYSKKYIFTFSTILSLILILYFGLNTENNSLFKNEIDKELSQKYLTYIVLIFLGIPFLKGGLKFAILVIIRIWSYIPFLIMRYLLKICTYLNPISPFKGLIYFLRIISPISIPIIMIIKTMILGK